MRFLVVEDDKVWQGIVASIAEAAGYEVDVVDDWSRFVNLIRDQKYAGMIVDLSLGLGSSSEIGVDTLRFVSRYSPPQTLILCTIHDNKLIEACHSLPFVKYVISKPRIAEYFSEVIEFFHKKLDRQQLETLVAADTVVRPQNREREKLIINNRETVFVVHGRNSVARREMFAFLRALGLKPVDWSEAVKNTREGSPYVGRVLDTAFEQAAAVVVLLTGDDEARLLEKFWTDREPSFEMELTKQPRPNVLFEAGLAFGRQPTRTILVQLEDVRPFSDVAGRHILRFSGSVEERNELAIRLETAGCAVRRTGDWISAGNFD